MIRGSGGSQLMLYLRALGGGTGETTKFMDKQKVQVMHDD